MRASDEELGVDPRDLSEEDLFRELHTIHSSRHETLRHGPDDALEHHTRRLTELEAEYLRRYPQREVDPGRVRAVRRVSQG
jgi:hypothetical protein